MKKRVRVVLARPGPAHAVRAFKHYGDLGGDRLAASIALPGFLAFFPLVALAFSVLGFVVDGAPHLQRELLDNVSSYLPGLLCSKAVAGHACTAGQIDVAAIARSKAGAGVIGLVGLVLAGRGWMGALRNGLQIVFEGRTEKSNIVTGFLRDLMQLALLGVGLVVSVGVGGVAGSFAGTAGGWIGLDGTLAALLIRVIGIGVSVAVNVALFVALFRGLGRARVAVRRGALVGAVGLGLLQQVGAFYIARTTHNKVYGSFAVVVGLLVWLVLVSRWTLAAAAWTRVADPASWEEPAKTVATREVEVPVPRDTGLPTPLLLAFAAGVGALVGRERRRSGES